MKNISKLFCLVALVVIPQLIFAVDIELSHGSSVTVKAGAEDTHVTCAPAPSTTASPCTIRYYTVDAYGHPTPVGQDFSIDPGNQFVVTAAVIEIDGKPLTPLMNVSEVGKFRDSEINPNFAKVLQTLAGLKKAGLCR